LADPAREPRRGVIIDNWRILDLSTFEGKLQYRRGAVVVCPKGQAEVAVPLADVATVFIGLKTAIEGAVLQQLAEFDVVALFCDWRGVPLAGMYGWQEHTRVGARHRAQVQVSVPRTKNAWGRVVRAKVRGQAANLRLLGSADWQHLEDSAQSVRSGDPGNVEAHAAHFYWSRVFADPGFKRAPGVGGGKNACLDYGYMVLRGHGIRAVLGAGLSPAIGLFHRGRGNLFNLVDDLIEPFRPAVDWVVAGMTSGVAPTHPSVKASLVAASSQPFDHTGLSVSAALAGLARQIGRYFEGDIDRLPVPSWSGPPLVAEAP
jgi:CRISPR-associated protein Cas1